MFSVVKYLQGFVFGKSGKQILNQRDAWKEEADCGCGPDCCNNKFAMPVNDSNGTTTYPADFQFVHVGGVVKLRVTVDLGAGPVVKEVDLS